MPSRQIKSSNAKPAATSPEKCPWLRMGKDGSKLRVEEFPTFQIWKLSNACKLRLTKQYLKPFELSVPEWRLIALIAQSAPLQFSALTASSAMDKGQVSRTLRALDQRGLVSLSAAKSARDKAPAGIAPRVTVKATAAGKNLYRRVFPAARRQQANLLGSLTLTERAAFYSGLRKLQIAIDKMQVSAGQDSED